VAREATRWASVRSDNTILPEGKAATGSSGNVQQTFGSSTALSGMALDPSKITFDTTWTAPPNGVTNCTTAHLPGCIVQVQVTYPYQAFLPFLPSGTINMKSTSQMVITQ